MLAKRVSRVGRLGKENSARDSGKVVSGLTGNCSRVSLLLQSVGSSVDMLAASPRPRTRRHSARWSGYCTNAQLIWPFEQRSVTPAHAAIRRKKRQDRRCIASLTKTRTRKRPEKMALFFQVRSLIDKATVVRGGSGEGGTSCVALADVFVCVDRTPRRRPPATCTWKSTVKAPLPRVARVAWPRLFFSFLETHGAQS
jgi:hypothetical protein